MSLARIKSGDIVVAVSGASAGRQGKVLRIDRGRQRAWVEGLNLVKKTIRRSQDYPQGDIVDREASIALSNLMPYDEKAKRGVRINRVRNADRSERRAKGSGHVLD